MRLLLLTQDFPPQTGGIETYCHELAKRWNNSVQSLQVMAPTYKNGNEFDSRLPYKVRRLPVKNSLLGLSAVIPLVFVSMRQKFDVVFHAQWQTLLASIITKKITGYPRKIYVAAHARELLLTPFAGRQGFLTRKMRKKRELLFKSVDGFFPVSNYTAGLLQKNGVNESKITIVGNGTDPQFFCPSDTTKLKQRHSLEEKTIILSVCRLVERKGMDTVLYALKQLIKERQDIVYLIGGSGPDEQRLKKITANLGLQPYVKFLGRIPENELPNYYSLADIFTMPAKNAAPDVEGFGIVFLEANACETPVIGSRTGGIPDAIEEMETGLLVEEENTSQLVDAFKKLLDSPKWAKEMGKQGRKRILEEATWNHAAEKILKNMKMDN